MRWARSLRRRRTRVVASADPIDAIKRAREQTFDLAVVDLRLGTTSGFEVVGEIKARTPTTSVVAISGQLSIQDTVRAMQCGAMDVFRKPVQIIEIVRRIEIGKRSLTPSPPRRLTLAEFKKAHVLATVADCNGDLQRAAELLQIKPTTVTRWLEKHISRRSTGAE